MGLIGYARISTSEARQVLDRQLDALHAAGCDGIFEDTASGAAAERPGLAACLDHLRRHDVLVVLDLDRLGRLAHDLITLIDGLKKRGIGFKAINSPMDTTTPAGRAFLQIQAAFAEMERNLIRQRVKEGILAVRAGPKRRPAADHDRRQAALCPTPHDRPVTQHSGRLSRARLYPEQHPLPLPACRRLAQGTRAKAPRQLTARVAFRTFMQKDP